MTSFLNAAQSHFDRNEFISAIPLFERALVLNPSQSDFLYKIAYCKHSQSDHDCARKYFESALIIDPLHEKSNQCLGVTLNELGDINRALYFFKICCLINPSDFVSHYNLGVGYFSMNEHSLSIKHLNRSELINPYSFEAIYNQGVVANQLGNHREAIDRYLLASKINPSHHITYFNLGVCFFELSNPHKAIEYFRLSLLINPDHIQSHWNLSHCLLCIDDYKNGFFEYEWRWKQNEISYLQKKREFNSKLWLGQVPIQNKSILIYAEQGFGDTLQFARFCNHPFFKAATVILEVQSELKNLIQASFPDITVIDPTQNSIETDFHVPLMSLALALGIDHPRDLDSSPYIRPRIPFIQNWEKRISQFPKPKVGLVWSSGYRKDQKETWEANQKRNLQLLSLHFLKDFKFSYFTLQKGFIPQREFSSLKQHSWGGPYLNDFTHYLTDFEQTAALITQLDLIITVDTALAHLAGSMGKPTLLLLKFNADWRWHHQKNDSMWYPNTRIFRQTYPAQWQQPLEELKTHLNHLLVTANYLQLL
jgi:tetratricopeptide (TPR) repeat protein